MRKVFLYIISALLLSSCDDYLDVEPKGLSIPNTVEEYSEMLNYSNVFEMDFALFMPDAYFLKERLQGAKLNELNAYMWNPNINSEGSSFFYDGAYRDINIANIILNDIDNVKSITGNEELRKNVKGHALAHRAMRNFLLVNVYSKQYNESTSDKDFAVPLILKSDINQKTPISNVKAIYSQILEDLKQAIPLLPISPKAYPRYRPCIAAAQALLAKVYMHMGKFNLALPLLKEAYSSQNELYNYNNEMVIEEPYAFCTIPNNIKDNKEALWYIATSSINVSLTDNFINNIIEKDKDKRFEFYYHNKDFYGNTVYAF